MSEAEAENVNRYTRALHAIQSGVAMLMNYPERDETTPKHLRVGVNSAHISNSAIVNLLIEKGVFTREEYHAKLADYAEAEVRSYEEMIKEHLGPGSTEIHLA